MRGLLRIMWPLFAALFEFGLFLGLTFPRFPPQWVGIGCGVTALVLGFSIRGGARSLSAFFKGAHGEERVGFLLATLPAGCHVFHDLPGGMGNIDHVVVGPQGIYAIETKCWSGKVTVAEDGRLLVDGKDPSRPPILQARRSAQVIGDYLQERMEGAPPCEPIVCFASDTFEPGRQMCGPVTVCNASELLSVLTAKETRLSSNEIERVVQVLEQKDES
ncbi:MAG: NERD domain-containing protein [Kiritimatiellae bacterium]|nr:NERD domain-containing protein [Kiritimatiellia bacterium]